jgi:hypothetical protein
MAGLTESYCRSNETSHASQFKWLKSHRRKESDLELDLGPDLLVRGADLDPHQNVTDPQHWD